MDSNGNGKKGGVSKLRELGRRDRDDSDGASNPDNQDVEFIYADTDTHANEIAELYTYSEISEFSFNLKAFDEILLHDFKSNTRSWLKLSEIQRINYINLLMELLESSKSEQRLKAARAVLYLAQGCWTEVQSDTEQMEWARKNVMQMYLLGVFYLIVNLLNYEIDNSTTNRVLLPKKPVTLADSVELRTILNVLYTFTEILRYEKEQKNSQYSDLVERFQDELTYMKFGNEIMALKLLDMITSFCSGSFPHFPIKKIVLLLWKVLLISLGGMDELRDIKRRARSEWSLSPETEDSVEITKHMRSSSPPLSASEILLNQNIKRNNRQFRRQSLMKQSSLDDNEYGIFEPFDDEQRAFDANENGSDLANGSEVLNNQPVDLDNQTIEQQNIQDSTPMTETPKIDVNNLNSTGNIEDETLVGPIMKNDTFVIHGNLNKSEPKTLPWSPKVRKKDIEQFLNSARKKFLGYTLPQDPVTLYGLPEPIKQSIAILQRHSYVSLGEVQIEKEERASRYPFTTQEAPAHSEPTEFLYQQLLPNLPHYMIALLKVLLAAAPTSKSRTETINILNDVIPEYMPSTIVQSMELEIDIHRHKEIIVKAVSATLFLLLKHFKVNHIYQFEYMSQHLVFANCIPLVLKFFNQNIITYVDARNSIPVLDFPSSVIGDQPELTPEALEIGDTFQISWRNMFSCINMLRILNKLTKWKHSRIVMLVVFKSAPILKRTLKIRHPLTQLYVLKLLKMQTKYLGRQWRKSNMKTISAIYTKVRHRINDDWAHGNDLETNSWDFQKEECALRACVERFNNRRYYNNSQENDEFKPVETNIIDVLGKPYNLSEELRRIYG